MAEREEASSPFVIEQDDEDLALDHELVDGDAIEADDPLQTTDSTPLTGRLGAPHHSSRTSNQNAPGGSPSGRGAGGGGNGGGGDGGGLAGRMSSNYLTNTIGGEDRRAAVNTIDESVWATLSRDMLAVWEKMRQVLWPKYLLGGMMAQRTGGGIGAAERGEAGSRGRDGQRTDGFGRIVGGVRGLVGRWPVDADTVLQGGMSEGLRDWDLWGPLVFCLLLSMFLSMRAHKDQASLVFSGMFCIVWIGEAVVTIQLKLLGANISFFQSVCIIGYTLFPLVIASVLSAFGLLMIARIPVYIALVAWSLAAGVSILGGSGVVKNRVGISVYPLFVFYVSIGCLCFIS